MKIEIHLLQNFAPSCLNRDDAGAPKQCEFGGVQRARISSQCSKRAIRDQFRRDGSVDVGTRTKRLKTELTARLAGEGRDDNELSHVLDLFLDGCYSKLDGKGTGETAVLLYLAEPEIAAAAAAVKDKWSALQPLALERIGIANRAGEAPKIDGLSDAAAKEATARWRRTVEKLKKDADAVEYRPDRVLLETLRTAGLSADVALFGRMLAEQAEMNVDAACQVAHPISTHPVNFDMDFFTAVDDLNPEGATGAGMMGHAGFNSACYYRYAVIDREQLMKNLKGDSAAAGRVIEAFLHAFTEAIPSGKQNSMAALNPPDFGMFVVRNSGVPISLANAFARPVRVSPDEEGADVIGESIRRLAAYRAGIGKVYGTAGEAAASVFHTDYARELGALEQHDTGSLASAIEKTMDAIKTSGHAHAVVGRAPVAEGAAV